MHARLRLSLLLTLLALSLVAFWKREPIRTWLANEQALLPTVNSHTAPELPRLPTLAGPSVQLAALRGQVVLLHFWTFGCSNCEHMIPHFADWHSRFGNQGLRIVGVHSPETMQERDVRRVADYANAHNIQWPVVLDPGFDAWTLYGVRGWPTMVLIDRSGVIRSVYVGDHRAGDIDAAIRGLLRG